MKKTKVSLTSGRLMQKFTTCLAVTAMVALAGLGCGNALAHDEQWGYGHDEFNLLLATYDEVQVAELDQLAADFHGALSYHGNITNMMSLWADNSSITLNGTAHVGKPAVQAFFLSSGYFLNNWVSLAPEYKTQIIVQGDKATITTQCVAIDISVTPNVVKSVIQVNATCEKIRGKWLFTSMNNTSPAPL
jgi:hypothetical protein